MELLSQMFVAISSILNWQFRVLLGMKLMIAVWMVYIKYGNPYKTS